MSDDLPSLAGFTPAAFEVDGPARARLSLELQDALGRWVDEAGIEAAVEQLNALGHELRRHGEKDGWVTYRSLLPDGDHHFQVAVEKATGDSLVSKFMTDEAWERRRAEERERLTPEERAKAETQERFYARGGALFAERYADWADLREPDRAVMAVYILITEVNNGGFSQYYVNTGGHQAEALVGYLKRIGTPRAAALVERSISVVGPPFSRELSESHWDALDEHADELGALDREFYDLEEDLATLTITWAEETAGDGDAHPPSG